MGSIPMANSKDWPENESSVDGSVGVDYHHGKSTLDDSRMEGAIRCVFGVSIFPTILPWGASWSYAWGVSQPHDTVRKF